MRCRGGEVYSHDIWRSTLSLSSHTRGIVTRITLQCMARDVEAVRSPFLGVVSWREQCTNPLRDASIGAMANVTCAPPKYFFELCVGGGGGTDRSHRYCASSSQ
jgi:hypothetical protein